MSEAQARVLRLPATAAGRLLLRQAIRDAGGWNLEDGSVVESHDWDSVVADMEAMAALDADADAWEASQA
ncbi:MAG: hypothetical protein ACHQRJ_13405 [Alphaproteobacteria bacterium]